MADEPQTIRGINWREAFPFTHIFRSFKVAIHPSKLVLGLVALIALFVGGWVLDRLWTAHSLAVPGEIGLYERAVTTGGTSDQFLAERDRTRDAVENAYSAKLVQYGVITNPDDANRAAERGDHLGDLHRKILESLSDTLKRDRTNYDNAYNQAAKITDPVQRSRAIRLADETYRTDVRAAYADTEDILRGVDQIKGVGLFQSLFNYESERINGVIRGVATWNWLGTSRDDRGPGVIESVINFFRIAPMWLMRFHPIYFIIYTLWFLTIWAIFGGAIARIAAVHVARDEKLSVRAALAFSLGKFLSFVSAPLIPLVIVLVVGLVPLIAGLLSSIPALGAIVNVIVAALFIIILAAGFVMTLVLLGTFGGFNLMYPTIAVEGSDSFDAISRSFSYVYARPWRMLFYTTVAVIYGALCYLFVKLFIWLMLSLTHQFVAAGYFASAQNLAPLWSTMWPGPQRYGTLSYPIDWLSLRWDQRLAAFLLAIWVYLVVAMLGAFVISFYFSANTIIYYLMRNEVDATEMDDVYVEQSDDDFSDTTMPIATASAASVGAVIVETTPTSPSAPPTGPADNPTPPTS